MRAPICILLGIGLSVMVSAAHASRLDKAARYSGTASSYDTSRVYADSTSHRAASRWLRSGHLRAWDTPWKTPLEEVPLPIGLSGAHGASSSEPTVDGALYGADGNVLSMAKSGNTLYIAGAFRSVGESSGGLVPYNTRTGEALASFPKVAGTVAAIVPDGTGGWYIGGEFTHVDGKPRSCLAQIRAGGTVTDWNPNVTGTVSYIAPPAVSALAVRGNRVFVGGAFRAIGGQPRMDLGCVDAQTGAVLDWVSDAPEGGFVWALALEQDTLFVAGEFSSLRGVPRSSLAAVNGLTGEVLPWQMDVFGSAFALLVRSDTLYVGGDFIGIAGQPQPLLAAVEIPSATLLPIDFRAHGISRSYLPSPQIDGLASTGDTLYAVGNFDLLGGSPRSGIAAVSASSGNALPWQPDTTGARFDGYPPLLCLSVAVDGPALRVGGYFTTVGGVYHPYVASWDRQTGRVFDWAPTPDDAVLAFGANGDTLLVGGYFHMVGGWQHRAGLAAIDLTTGRVKSWNPNPNGTVCTAVAVHGDQVLVSGAFSVIGGDPQPRNAIAALDTVNGEVTVWNPGANDASTVFLLSGDTLYVGGMFSSIGGQPRNGLAAIDAVTGAVLPWDPNAGSHFDGYSVVHAMARSGDTILLGGTFTEMGGQSRLGLAAVDATTGELGSWNPGTDNSTVDALLISGTTLYVGGEFTALAGQARNAIGAVDLVTGRALPWYPAPTAWGAPTDIKALVLRDNLLYIGGAFASMSGVPRICLAAVDTSTALTTSWDAALDGYVWSLLSSGSTLFVGGGFSRAGGIPATRLAAFTLPTGAVPPPRSLSLAPCTPNPVRAIARIQFGLPHAGPVTLSIYDLQGRRVAVPLDRSNLSAGLHIVQVDVRSWRPGVYLYRVAAGHEQSTRKLVVVK